MEIICIYIYGGYNRTVLSDVQKFYLVNESWTNINVEGQIPNGRANKGINPCKC